MKHPILWKKIAVSVLGSLIMSFGMYNIHAQSQVTEGGVIGMTLLCEHWLGISPAITGLFFNLVCYFLGFLRLGWSFIGYSAVSALSFSAFYAIWESFPPLWPQIADHPLSAALVGALFIGVGAGICVRCGGAPGGDDALAMALTDRFHMTIARAYLLIDLAVLGLSLTYIPLRRILYSLLTVVLSGQIVDLVSRDWRSWRKKKA